MRTTFVARGTAFCLLVLCSALTACGGGSGSLPASPVTPATTSPTPTPTPTATPPASTTQSATVPVSPSATTAPLPAAGGFSASVSLPTSNAAANTTIAATSTTVAPSNAPALQAVRRRVPFASNGATLSAYFYESFTASSTITFNGTPGFSITLPSSVQTGGQQFYVALFAPGTTQWQLAVEGPAQVNGQTLTFAGQSGQSVTLTAGQTYWFAFYSVPAAPATPTPTPAPSATPTPAPSATPTPAPSATPTAPPASAFSAQPASLSLTGTGAASMQAFSVTGGTEPYTVSGYDDTIVSVTPDSSGSGIYDVTPLKAGSTTITINDSAGASSTISVTVTTVSGAIQ